MPFTPFHLGPGLVFGIVLFRWLDFPTFITASVVVDLRATLVFFGILDGRLHGPLHTFVFGTTLAIVLSAGVYSSKSGLNRLLAPFQFDQPRAWRPILTAALGGVSLHIVLDSILYTDIRPFYPTSYNPFFGLLSTPTVYGLCVVALAAGGVAYGVSLRFPRYLLGE